MERIVQRISDWASAQSEIRLVLVVGSRARPSPPPDRWSDLDLWLFCTDCSGLINQRAWLEVVGEVWVCLTETGEGGSTRLMVLLEGAEKVDFDFLPIDALLSPILSKRLTKIHGRGFYALVDIDRWSQLLPPVPGAVPLDRRPTEAAFRRTVDAFLYRAVYVAKQIRRGNLWVAKYRDWTMKTELLQIVEWHAKTLTGQSHDTLYDGHLMEDWADSTTWEHLRRAFGRFDEPDSWRALIETMHLFRRLATQVALHLGHEYPAGLDARVNDYVRQLRLETRKLEPLERAGPETSRTRTSLEPRSASRRHLAEGVLVVHVSDEIDGPRIHWLREASC